MSLSHVQTTSNHMGQDMESRVDVTTPHEILHITTVMRCCTVLEQNDTMLKQF